MENAARAKRGSARTRILALGTRPIGAQLFVIRCDYFQMPSFIPAPQFCSRTNISNGRKGSAQLTRTIALMPCRARCCRHGQWRKHLELYRPQYQGLGALGADRPPIFRAIPRQRLCGRIDGRSAWRRRRRSGSCSRMHMLKTKRQTIALKPMPTATQNATPVASYVSVPAEFQT